jgi:hypothetical protein
VTDATIAVRKPAIDTEDRRCAGSRSGIEPSRYCLRAMCSSPTMFRRQSMQISSAMSTASGSTKERRRVVELVRADGVVMDAVVDVLPRLLLHQRRAVVLAQLRQRRPHVTEDLRRRSRADSCPAGQRQNSLRARLELLVDFEARLEADGGVVLGVISSNGLRGSVFMGESPAAILGGIACSAPRPWSLVRRFARARPPG